jgi:hypothetical protein
MPAAPDQPDVPDQAQDLVLPSTGPASPGLIDVNDPQSPPASSSTPQPDVSLALLPDTVLDQSMSPATILPESSSVAELGSSTVPTVVGLGHPHTRLQDGIRRSKVYLDGTFQYAYSLTSGESYLVQEALSSSSWKAAMLDEYNALMHNQTLSVFFASARYRVVKIAVSCSEVVL